MGGRKAHTYDEVKDYLNQYGYVLISKEYVRQTDKLDMICDKGHPCSISFKNFKNGKRCKKCSNKNRSLSQRTPFNEILEFVKSCGGKLITTEDEYVNSYTPLKLICPNGHPFENTYQSIKKTDCRCHKCRDKQLSEIKRTDGEIVIKEFLNRGFTPKFNADYYINAHQKLPYICNKHIDKGVKYTSYDSLIQGKFVCKSCYLENNSKDNHWNWQGGISSLSDYLRVRLNDWKYESLKAFDFKCVITKIHTKDLEIHHLYNFSDIVNEVLSTLNLPINKINEYTIDELDYIENKFMEIHDSYGLGVPLTKEIHVLYHKIYQFKNNTPEQFNEFVERYKNGEFNSLLEEVV